ncbi:MAG: sensor histidine kinase [Bacteroidetes bacterium]|nr:sensor histidine kinase [Bacteroidota bacterium]
MSSSIIVLYVAGTLLLTVFAFSLIVLLLVQKRKQNRFRKEKEQLQLEMMKMSMEVQEEAMNKISQELHDNIGARLNAVKRNFMAAEAVNAETATALKGDALKLLDDVIKDARDVSHLLNSDYITKHGLVASVKKELDDVRRTSGIDCNLTLSDDYYSMDAQKELLIFRMVQESVANTLKHAEATRLDIQLNYEREMFYMTITDDGKGFDELSEKAESGIGLINMRNRVKMIKGNFAIQSTKNKGTTISFSIKTT